MSEYGPGGPKTALHSYLNGRLIRKANNKIKFVLPWSLMAPTDADGSTNDF